MKAKVAEGAFVSGGRLAGRGVVLMPVDASRTNPPERERQQRDSNHWRYLSEFIVPRWLTGPNDDAPEVVNSSLEGDLRWPAF
jgi:hypothetical protein